MKIILLGAPGAGKGTYASRLKKTYDLPHVSTGDLLRESIKNNTESGLKAKEYMDKGEFVPDETIVSLLKERMSQNDAKSGVLLDGFPRTKQQAEILDEIIKADKVLNFDIDKEIVLKRLGGRLICKGCGEIFNKHKLPPKQEGTCDHCEDDLYQREDDTEETILERLKIYEEQTKPLIDHYSDKNMLHTIDSNTDISHPECTVIEECEDILNKIKL
jgi:adenylate kinase